ncbi:MAG: hypothetical protein JWO38_410 [Gemmataceae bacterium]|nr:hypothetical protein [Gemmataceae bacterium]
MTFVRTAFTLNSELKRADVPNLRILVPNLGDPASPLPVGAVVHPSLVAGGRYEQHLALGTVEETDLPLTHGRVPGFADQLPAGLEEALAENGRLRARVSELEAENVGLEAKAADLTGQLHAARRQTAHLEEQLVELTTLARLQVAATDAARFGAGGISPSTLTTISPIDTGKIQHLSPALVGE